MLENQQFSFFNGCYDNASKVYDFFSCIIIIHRYVRIRCSFGHMHCSYGMVGSVLRVPIDLCFDRHRFIIWFEFISFNWVRFYLGWISYCLIRCNANHLISKYMMYLHAADLGNVHPCIQAWDLQLDGFSDSILAFIAVTCMFLFALDGIGYGRFALWSRWTMATGSATIVYRSHNNYKAQFDQLHLFTIVIFDNCCIAYTSFALQFPHASPALTETYVSPDKRLSFHDNPVAFKDIHLVPWPLLLLHFSCLHWLQLLQILTLSIMQQAKAWSFTSRQLRGWLIPSMVRLGVYDAFSFNLYSRGPIPLDGQVFWWCLMSMGCQEKPDHWVWSSDHDRRHQPCIDSCPQSNQNGSK